MDSPNRKSNQLHHERKLRVKSRPVSLGALQNEQRVRTTTMEELTSVGRDDADLPAQAGGERSCRPLDESANCLTKFEDKSVRSWNRLGSQRGLESDSFRAEASKINPGKLQPLPTLPLVTGQSPSVGAQLPRQFIPGCVPLETNDDNTNRPTKDGLPSIMGNVSLLGDFDKLAEERLSDLWDKEGMFHAKFEEALKQGNSVRLKLQELLELERSKHKSSKKELKQMKRNFELFWNSAVESFHVSQNTGLQEAVSSKLPSEDDQLELESFEHKSSKGKLKQMKNLELVWTPELGFPHESKDINLVESLSSDLPARGEEEDELAFDRKKAKEKCEYLLSEKAKLDLEFEAQLERFYADRVRLQALFDLEKYKHNNSQKELKELKPNLGKCLFKEETEEATESIIFLGNLASSVARPGVEKIDSNRSCNDGRKNYISNPDDYKMAEETFIGHSKPSVSVNNVPFDKAEGIRISKTGEKTLVKELTNQQKLARKPTEEAIEKCEKQVKHLKYDKVKLEGTVEGIQNISQKTQNVASSKEKTEMRDPEGEILRRYTCIYQSPIFEDCNGGNVDSRESIIKRWKQNVVNFVNHDSAKEKGPKEAHISGLQEEMKNLTDQLSCSRGKMDKVQELHKFGDIHGMPESFDDSKVVELHEVCLLHSVVSDHLMNIVEEDRKVRMQGMKSNSISNLIEHENNTVQSQRTFVVGEDTIDKNVIVDNTMLEQEQTSRAPINIFHRSLEKMGHGFNKFEVVHLEMSENKSTSFEDWRSSRNS